jgi:hypothetical protein
LQEYNIGLGVAANHTQLATVEGPVKVHDAFRFEVGDLLSRRAIERLEPEIIGVLVTESINDSFAIMGETDKPSWVLQVQKFLVLRSIHHADWSTWEAV